MLDAIPSLPVIAAFSLAGIILAITPGPDMTLFLSRTLTNGRASGIASVLGANVGCLVHTMLAVLGISALLAASPTGFWLLKIIGAAYLVWLAVQAILHGSSLSLEPAQKSGSLWKDFAMGVGINILNPKVAIFFITFLPQFVSADDPAAWKKMLFLGVYFVALSLPLVVGMVFAADGLAHTLRQNPRVTRVIDYVFATIFATFAVKILLTEGR